MMNVMPTIMHMYGLAPPPNFEGRIMYEIFEPDSPYARRSRGERMRVNKRDRLERRRAA